MTLIAQPVQEAYFYKEARKIQPGAGVLFGGYSIYHLHRRISNTTSIRLNEIEYWQPLPALASYKEYVIGDEFVQAERVIFEPRLEISVKPRKRYYVDSFPVYTHKYCGLKLFIATNRTKTYPLPRETNPYSYRKIQEWIESSETYEDTFDEYDNLIVPSYWYHPFKNAFYNFGNIPAFGIRDTQYLIDSLFSGDTSGESNESLLANAIDSIRNAQIDELISQGRSRENATALVNAQSQRALSMRAAQSSVISSSGVSILSSGSSAGTNGQLISVNVRSSSASQLQKTSVSISASQNPTLVQTATSGKTGLRYEFKHRPNQISYTSIGAEWTPIERAANRPMIDWKSYKLMSVSFSFIVAPDESGSLDSAIDGKVITTSIDNELKNLRQMASSPFPVTFHGFDKLLSEPARHPFNNDGGGKGSLFVIADFSITSIYRSSTGAISRASCDMTLTEYPKELIKLIEFPKFRPIPEVPPPPPTEGKGACDSTLPGASFGGNQLSDRQFLRNLAAMEVIKYDEATGGRVDARGRPCQSIVIMNAPAYERATQNRKINPNLVNDNVPWSEFVAP